jgi:hypothetical protein
MQIREDVKIPSIGIKRARFGLTVFGRVIIVLIIGEGCSFI